MTPLPIQPCSECRGTTWELDLEAHGTLMVDAGDPTDGPELLLELADIQLPLTCASCGAEAFTAPTTWDPSTLWELPHLKVILQKLT